MTQAGRVGTEETLGYYQCGTKRQQTFGEYPCYVKTTSVFLLDVCVTPVETACVATRFLFALLVTCSVAAQHHARNCTPVSLDRSSVSKRLVFLPFQCSTGVSVRSVSNLGRPVGVMTEEARTVDATAMDGPLESVTSDDKFHSSSTSPPPAMSSDMKVLT